MNRVPDGYIAVECQKCGARFTTEERAEGHGCDEKYWENP